MKSSSCSSSSVPTGRWKYDVFLSFRGEDTRYTFVDHLYAALVQRGICVVKDDDELKKGKAISPELLKAIEESRFAVVISKNYANSSWCLAELAKIMEWHNQMGQRVLPVFYHVDPSDIRGQKNDIAIFFRQHEEKFRGEMDKVKEWRGALTATANLSGMHISETFKDAFNRLAKSPNVEIFETLKLSKKIFLDIACFFKGRHVGDVTKVLESCGFDPLIEISVLAKKSLITISNDRIGRFTSSEPMFFPADLRWLCWSDYPFSSLSTTQMSKLVGLEVVGGSIKQFWNRQKRLKRLPSRFDMKSLRHLHLTKCSSLDILPDVSTWDEDNERYLDKQSFHIGIPGNKIPSWFIEEQPGHNVAMMIPPNCNMQIIGVAQLRMGICGFPHSSFRGFQCEDWSGGTLLISLCGVRGAKAVRRLKYKETNKLETVSLIHG
ncbi:hypothetical protein L1987_46307 [Smallanthus sonchifolius]|uniref:Uncharacterized protein n=1 Tax=Smallanthus sonchifolius TaxID=185202 RepID=A0ACB9FZ71_9ASTR|nr:hypothetical protein L1987_46307 [Smallanthus sonchifolius]